MNILKSGFRGGKIVRRLDEFPELVEALRDGDLLTGRLCCAELFDFDAGESSLVREQASANHAHALRAIGAVVAISKR